MNAEQILLAILLALSSWTLHSIVRLREQLAGLPCRKCPTIAASLACLLLVGYMCGCSTARPPTKLERWLFNVQTNSVVDRATPEMAMRPVASPETAVEDPLSPDPVTIFSSIAGNGGGGRSLEYVFSPGAGAETVKSIGGAVAAPFGVGGLVSTALSGLFALWASFRSARANKTATVLAQVIETGRGLLDPKLGDKWRSWMIDHQAKAGVIDQVRGILRSAVDRQSAASAAQQLKSMIA